MFCYAIMVIKSSSYKNSTNIEICASDLQCRYLIIAMSKLIDQYRDAE